MHRLEAIAMENFSSYREALSEAYSGEIENVEEGLWWVKVRYRAGRIARRRRREQKLAQVASRPAPVPDAEPVGPLADAERSVSS